jgi:hypothetical protein
MAPEGRMVVAAVCLLFFGAFAAGALNTARQEWRWRDGEQVRGVLIKQGRWYHYEFTPVKGEPPIVGAKFYQKTSSEPRRRRQRLGSSPVRPPSAGDPPRLQHARHGEFGFRPVPLHRLDGIAVRAGGPHRGLEAAPRLVRQARRRELAPSS